MSEDDSESREALLREICSARLTSVQFVMDYLILGFDQKGALTTLVWPEITNQEFTITFGMPGYRDSLCALIEQRVKAVNITEDFTIFICFDDDASLQIPLGKKEYPGETAIFAGSHNRLAVWW